jgi:hypothetical protein
MKHEDVKTRSLMFLKGMELEVEQSFELAEKIWS